MSIFEFWEFAGDESCIFGRRVVKVKDPEDGSVVVGVGRVSSGGPKLNGRGTRRHSAAADLEPHARKTKSDLRAVHATKKSYHRDVVPFGKLNRFLTKSPVFEICNSGERTHDHQCGTRAKSAPTVSSGYFELDPPMLTVFRVSCVVLKFVLGCGSNGYTAAHGLSVLQFYGRMEGRAEVSLGVARPSRRSGVNPKFQGSPATGDLGLHPEQNHLLDIHLARIHRDGNVLGLPPKNLRTEGVEAINRGNQRQSERFSRPFAGGVGRRDDVVEFTRAVGDDSSKYHRPHRQADHGLHYGRFQTERFCGSGSRGVLTVQVVPGLTGRCRIYPPASQEQW
ncbi:hypothetical protein GEV33_001580 [Tenebrio molitor]|uniref:Uncharacterized protein n=1 Tax=Tenebrio molitor TaxID=7067 RepID=A0A8J6LQ30_TENMO|nr:hypothetical protein GEV33_001580 [Tenebrio molitor]